MSRNLNLLMAFGLYCLAIILGVGFFGTCIFLLIKHYLG